MTHLLHIKVSVIYFDLYRTWNHTRHEKCLEEKYGKLIQVKVFNGEVLKKSKNEKYDQQVADITDGEGLKLAYETKDGLYQRYNKLLIAGTKDFPVDHTDDSKTPFDDT